MDRRRFLTTLGVGAAGAATGAVGASALRSEPGTGHTVIGPGRGAVRVVWSGPGSVPSVALTVRATDAATYEGVLAAVGSLGIPVTLVVTGLVARRRPDLLAGGVAAGHEVAHAGWSGRPLGDADADEAGDEIRRGSAAVARATGVPPRWYRPPEGQLTGAVLAAVAANGQEVLLSSGAPSSTGSVTRALAPGAVVEVTRPPGPEFAGSLRRAGVDGWSFLTVSALVDTAVEDACASGGGGSPVPAQP